MELPRTKRSLWPVLVAALVVLVVLVGGGLALVATSGDGAGDPEVEETGRAGDDLDFAAIDERYRSLGRVVTAGASECEEQQPATGETEVVICTTPDGTLTLTTYADAAAAQAARSATLDRTAGTIVSDVESGAFYSYEPTVLDASSSEPAIVYWDSAPGLQSALHTGADGVTAEELREAFDATAPMVTPPTGPVDVGVRDLVSRFDVGRCRRIPTRMAGETEESECVRSGRRTWVAQLAGAEDFRTHREEVLALAGEDRFPVRDFWYVDQNDNDQQDDPAEVEQGRVYGYVEEAEGDRAVLYLDDARCLCFLRMHGEPGDGPKVLYELLFPSPQPGG